MTEHFFRGRLRKHLRRIGAIVVGLLCCSVFSLFGACAVDSVDRASPGVNGGDSLTLTPIRQIGAGLTDRVRIGFAVAVAARAGNVYIVDSTNRALIRANSASGDVRIVRQVSDANQPGLIVTPDHVVYLVDRASRAVLEIDESGRVRRTLHDDRLLAAPVDVAQAGWGGIIIADGLTNELVVFDPFFGPADIIGGNRTPSGSAVSITAIAGGSESVYVLDATQREVVEFDLSGRLIATYGEDDLRVPAALAVDDCGRVVVADGHPGGLYVGATGESRRVPLDATINEAINDLWIDGNELYVAAGAAGVQVFLMEPPCR